MTVTVYIYKLLPCMRLSIAPQLAIAYTMSCIVYRLYIVYTGNVYLV